MGSIISNANNIIINNENAMLQNSRNSSISSCQKTKNNLTATFNNHSEGTFSLQQTCQVDVSKVLTSQYNNEIDNMLAGVAASEQSTEKAWPMSIKITPGTSTTNTKTATRNYIANILSTTCLADDQILQDTNLKSQVGTTGTSDRDFILLNQTNDPRLNCTLNNLSRVVGFNTTSAGHKQESRKGDFFIFLLIVLIIFIIIIALVAIFIIGFHTTSSTVHGSRSKREALLAAELAHRRELKMLYKQEEIRPIPPYVPPITPTVQQPAIQQPAMAQPYQPQQYQPQQYQPQQYQPQPYAQQYQPQPYAQQYQPQPYAQQYAPAPIAAAPAAAPVGAAPGVAPGGQDQLSQLLARNMDVHMDTMPRNCIPSTSHMACYHNFVVFHF